MTQPTYDYRAPQKLPRMPSQNDGLTITGFILAFFLPVLGLILSWVAVHVAHRDGRKAAGLAIAGLVIGAVGTLTWLIIFIAIISAVATSTDPTVTATCAITDPRWPYC